MFTATSKPPSQESCLFNTWLSTGPVTLVNINVDSAVTITGDTGSVIASIYWSKDSGLTWNTLFSTYVSRDRTIDQIAISGTVDLASIMVKGVVYGGPTPSGGGGGGGDPCPLSGAPVRLYGDPSWWTMEVQPAYDWIEIITATGRRGLFTPNDRRFCDRGLIEVQKWEAGFYALVDDTEERLELVESVQHVYLPGATADHYHATEGHVYSAWGFVGHNNKVAVP